MANLARFLKVNLQLISNEKTNLAKSECEGWVMFVELQNPVSRICTNYEPHFKKRSKTNQKAHKQLELQKSYQISLSRFS